MQLIDTYHALMDLKKRDPIQTLGLHSPTYFGFRTTMDEIRFSVRPLESPDWNYESNSWNIVKDGIVSIHITEDEAYRQHLESCFATKTLDSLFTFAKVEPVKQSELSEREKHRIIRNYGLIIRHALTYHIPTVLVNEKVNATNVNQLG